MAKKKGPEMYEGKPVLVAANSKKLEEAVEKFKADYPDIPLEAPYVVRVKGKTVKSRSFMGDSSVGVVLIAEGVTAIEMQAFATCENLKTVEIPASIADIAYFALYECVNLERMIVSPDNPAYDSRNNCNAIIDSASNVLLFGCRNTTIPDGVLAIANNAFRLCSKLESIDLPDTVTTISSQAFIGCSGLKSLFIPASVTSIEAMAFDMCIGLESIKVDSRNSVYDSRNESNTLFVTATGEVILDCMNSQLPESFKEHSYEVRMCADALRMRPRFCDETDEQLKALLALSEKTCLEAEDQDFLQEVFDELSENDEEYYSASTLEAIIAADKENGTWEECELNGTRTILYPWQFQVEDHTFAGDGQYAIVSFYKWSPNTIITNVTTKGTLRLSVDVFTKQFIDEKCFKYVKQDKTELDHDTNAQDSGPNHIKVFKKTESGYNLFKDFDFSRF